jgi:iron complex outermembrane receptor protein
MRIAFARAAMTAALTTTSLVGFSGSALADGNADAAPADATATKPADVPSTGEIIVSARRRSETLSSTPVAITAITASMLENKASANIGDLTGAAPGLLITQQNTGAAAANLSIRGLTYADVEKSQTPTVGVVVDGVTIGTSTGQLQDAFDIAQIEVLRGPQGTLFGANTIGGVISIQRSLPTMTPGAKLEATYGQWNTWDAKAIVNYGNGSSWGVKGWYFHDNTDGFYYNTTTKSRTGGSKNDNFGASLLFKPVGSPFNAQLTVEDLVQSFTPVNISLTKPGEAFYGIATVPTDLYQVSDAPTHSTYHAPAVTLNAGYDAGFIKLTAITGWRHSTEDQTQDFATAGFYYARRRQQYTQFSQELRGGGKLSDKLDYVVGGYFFSSDYHLIQWTDVGHGSALNNAPDPSAVAPGEQHTNGYTKSYAVFGDFNWAFADKFRLSFGGRWSHDNKKLDNGFYNVANGADTNFALVGSGNANFSKFTPKLGIDYRADSNTLFYASWTRGYRSGGFSSRAATAATASTPFTPETVDSFELGTKFNLLDHKLQLNLAGYVSDYKNMQQNLTVPGGPTGNQTITGNVPGGALIKGIEGDATFRPIEGLKLTATAAYMESHFRNYIVGGVSPVSGQIVNYNYSANNLIYAPKFSASFSGDYTVPTAFGKVVGTAGIRHISPYDEQISAGSLSGDLTNGPITVDGNDPRVRTITQNLVDASLTVDFKMAGADAYVRFFGRNLANIHTTTAAFTVAGLWTFGSAIEPRTYGGTIGVKF